jgi:hypothetical protein
MKPESIETKNGADAKEFTFSFMADKVRDYLKTDKKNVRGIFSSRPSYSGNEVTISLKIETEKNSSDLNITFINKGDNIGVKENGVEVKSDSEEIAKWTKDALLETISKIPEKLKADMANGDNKTVKKFEIVNSGLKITFASAETGTAPVIMETQTPEVSNKHNFSNGLFWERLPDGSEKIYDKDGKVLRIIPAPEYQDMEEEGGTEPKETAPTEPIESKVAPVETVSSGSPARVFRVGPDGVAEQISFAEVGKRSEAETPKTEKEKTRVERIKTINIAKLELARVQKELADIQAKKTETKEKSGKLRSLWRKINKPI